MSSDPTKTNIPNGIYTVIGPKGYKTFRIETAKDGNLKGKRILSILCGSNNEHNYRWFATVADSGIFLWKPYQGKTAEMIEAKKTELDNAGDNSDKDKTLELWKYGKIYTELVYQLAVGNQSRFPSYRLEVAKCCLRCNRTLTTPKALEAGIGADCLAQMKANL